MWGVRPPLLKDLTALMIGLVLLAWLQASSIEAPPIQAPSAATCAAAYSLEILHSRSGRGAGGGGGAPGASGARLLRQGAIWNAIGTRDAAAMRATAAELRRQTGQADAAREAFKACAQIDALTRVPALPPPPAPVRPPAAGCLFSVVQVRAEQRACVAPMEIEAIARAAQQQLERGGLSCRSVAEARQTWVDLGLAASAAAMQARDPKCAR